MARREVSRGSTATDIPNVGLGHVGQEATKPKT